MKYLLILFSLNVFSQGFSNDITHVLGNFETSNSVGNPCGIDNFMDVHVYGDMNMNGHFLQVANAKITIHGQIVNEGTIQFMCAEAEIIVIGTLDTNENEVSDLKVFPIPTNDYLYITGTGINTIVIYNIHGEQLKRFITPTTNNMIDLSNLINGMYFVKVNNITKKIIKI